MRKVGFDLVCPLLGCLLVPYQHVKSTISAAWRSQGCRLSILRAGASGAALCLDCEGTKQLLFFSHLREGKDATQKYSAWWRLERNSYFGKSKEEDVPCRFCGGVDGDGHLFWDCTFPPLVRIREHPEFASLVACDRSNWPLCLSWHGWLPALMPRRAQPPWAIAIVDYC